MKINERQSKFAEEYQRCGNASEAARRAGYGAAGSRVTAHRLLTNANVRAALAARQRIAASEAWLTRQDAISGLQEAIAVALQQGNSAAMIAGWREIGRMLGFYEPEVHKVELGADGTRLQAKFTSMSDGELLALATGQSVLTEVLDTA